MIDAAALEKSLSKKQILELYLNRIYLGSGAYGVDGAAHIYFGKSARDLTLAEAAMLATLTRAPSVFSPRRDLARAQERAGIVLDAMVETGAISQRTGRRGARPSRHRRRPHRQRSAQLLPRYRRRRSARSWPRPAAQTAHRRSDRPHHAGAEDAGSRARSGDEGHPRQAGPEGARQRSGRGGDEARRRGVGDDRRRRLRRSRPSTAPSRPIASPARPSSRSSIWRRWKRA